MLRPMLFAFACLIAVPAMAQQPAPQPERGSVSPEQREQRRAEIMKVRDACREEVRGKGIKGSERREAMKSCILAKRPELAKPMACAEEARAKGLKRGDERRAFMRTCVRGA